MSEAGQCHSSAIFLHITSGPGNDWVDFDSGEAEGNLVVKTGAGDDVFTDDETYYRSGKTRFDMGPGNDYLYYEYPIFYGRVILRMSDGHDVVELDDVAFEGHVLLEGGKGQDSLRVWSTSFAVEPHLSGFEDVVQ